MNGNVSGRRGVVITTPTILTPKYLKKMNTKILHLPLKKEWYEMIECGEKLEEYREIKEHWIKRICKSKKLRSGFCCEVVETDITHVCFSYGYTRRKMLKKVLKIYIGFGNIDWGAPKYDKVFIIEFEKEEPK